MHKESGGWRVAAGGGSCGEVGSRRTASGAATLGNRGLSDFFSLLLIMHFLGEFYKYFLRRGGRPGSCFGTPGAGGLAEHCAQPRAAASRWRLPQDEAAASAGPAVAGASRLSKPAGSGGRSRLVQARSRSECRKVAVAALERLGASGCYLGQTCLLFRLSNTSKKLLG